MHPSVYLVRHGESEWNVRRLTQGQTRHPRLTAFGREQAAGAADAIAADLARLGLSAARLVTSDLVRAVETAQIVGERIGLVPELDARLREQHLGELEGRSYEDSWARAGLHDWSDPELPLAGGESVGQVRRRLAAVLAELRPGTPTVLVSHGDAIRSAVAHLLGQRPYVRAASAWVRPCLVMAVMTSLALDTGEHHGPRPCRCRETCLADVLSQHTAPATKFRLGIYGFRA